MERAGMDGARRHGWSAQAWVQRGCGYPTRRQAGGRAHRPATDTTWTCSGQRAADNVQRTTCSAARRAPQSRARCSRCSDAKRRPSPQRSDCVPWRFACKRCSGGCHPPRDVVVDDVLLVQPQAAPVGRIPSAGVATCAMDGTRTATTSMCGRHRRRSRGCGVTSRSVRITNE